MDTDQSANNNNNSNNDNPYYTIFQAGVTAALRSWSALHTAVEQSWGGNDSSAKAEDLRSNIFTFFNDSSSSTYTTASNNKPKMSLYELESNLYSYMEEEYGILLEDNSEIEISTLIYNMYEDCLLKKNDVNVTLAMNVISNAIKAEEQKMGNVVKDMSVIQNDNDDDDDDDDSCSDDDDDDDMEMEDMEMDDNNNDIMGMEGGGQQQPLSSAAVVAVEQQQQQQQSPFNMQTSAVGMYTNINNNNSSSNEAATLQHNLNMAQAYLLASGTLFGNDSNNTNRSSKPKKELPPPRQLGEKEPEKPQPELDDDGFAAVVTKKKGGGGT